MDEYENNVDEMYPEEGRTTIAIPMTFERKGGRSEDTSQRIMLFVIATILTVAISVLVALGNGITFKTILILAVVIFVYQFISRRFVFREGYFKEQAKVLEEKDYSFDFKTFWGIYDISDTKPYICTFRNEEKCMFVKLEKDIIIGDTIALEFEHYESISEAYRKLSLANMSFKYIDMMDKIGNDDRLKVIYENIEDTKSPILKEVYTCVFENLRYDMEKEYTSYDIFMFRSRMDDESFYHEVLSVLQSFLEGSYTSYTIMGADDLEDFTRTIMNLQEFSVNEACRDVLKTERRNLGVTLISGKKYDGEIVEYNKRRADKILENQIREREKAVRKGRRFRRVKDEEIDLGDEEDEIDLDD